MIKHCYQLSEHSQLTNVDLTQEDVQTLLALFVGKLDVTTNMATSKYNLQSYQYAGVIALPHTKIIIEPKTKIVNLNYMISKVYGLATFQNCATEFGSIKEWSDFVLLLFLELVTELTSKGLNKHFQEIKENSTTIKGGIDFVKQAKENFGYPLQHHCNYTEVSSNTIENQILKLALHQVYSICELESQLIWQLNKLEKYFTSVSLPNLIKINLSQLSFNRLNEQYRFPLALAQMILEMCSPLLEGNSHLFPAFLIDLNRLFERYVADYLAKTCSNYQHFFANKLTLSYQTQDYLDQTSQIRIIPDLVLSSGEKALAVIDTKYKLATSELNRDYYQIISYCLAKNTLCGVLVYPNWEIKREKIYIKNTSLVVECIGVVLDKGVQELNGSIDSIIQLITKANS